MDYKQAIEAIKANYPPENYTMLRKALDLAIKLLEEDSEKAEKVKDLTKKVRHYEMMYHNTGAMFNRMTMKEKIERYEKA